MENYDVNAAHKYFQAKLNFTTGAHELEGIVSNSDKNIRVIDVRYAKDFAEGHVPGAINLPKGKWRNTAILNKGDVHYIYCYNPTCHLAAEAAVELTQQGYEVVEVEGGWATWLANGSPVERIAKSA